MRIFSENHIVQHDPILRLFYAKWQWKDIHIVLFTSLVSGLLLVVLGTIASSVYKGSGNRIETWSNLAFLATWLLLFSPSMWGAYIWQARTAPLLFLNLDKKGVFGSGDAEQRSMGGARHLLNLILEPRFYWITLLALVVFWLNEYFLSWPEQFQINTEYWYEVKWYTPFYILAWSIGLYALFLFAIRQVVFVFGMAKLFSNVEVEIKPLDPDEVGGLGIIGDFAKTSLFFAVIFGIIALLFGTYIHLSGSNIFHRTDVLGLFGLYIILAPVCLFVPVYSARNAMLRTRQRILGPVAREFQETMVQAQSKLQETLGVMEAPESLKELKTLNEKLQLLKDHQEMVMQAYPVMPIPANTLRKFSITAALPLISGTVSLALDLFTN